MRNNTKTKKTNRRLQRKFSKAIRGLLWIILKTVGLGKVPAKNWLTKDRMADVARAAAETEELPPVGRGPK